MSMKSVVNFAVKVLDAGAQIPPNSALHDDLCRALAEAETEAKPAAKVNSDGSIIEVGDLSLSPGELLYLNPPCRELSDEELLGAIARGWCSPENSSKEMDTTLAMAISNEVRAVLRAAGGEG